MLCLKPPSMYLSNLLQAAVTAAALPFKLDLKLLNLSAR